MSATIRITARCGLLLAAVIGRAIGTEAAQPGIAGVTHGAVDLSIPPSTPTGQIWRYGLGMPLQLDATTVGLLANIRRNGTPYGDFEVGTDLVMFDSLSSVNTSRLVPISRPTFEKNPITGVSSITAKYPVSGGFVPFGAVFASNSSLHPYGGTGFGISEVAFYPDDFQLPLPPENQLGYRLEVQQFQYNGSQFTASPPVRLEQWSVGGAGWEIKSPGLSPAIPDGNDLLMAVTCANTGVGDASVAGVARFQYGTSGWQPTSFAPITDTGATWWEPSLIRDVDGSLLFSARNPHVNGMGDIPLWRSSDGGQGWDQVFFLKGARTGTPLVLNQAADGTPYFATNTAVGTDRNILQVVPLNADRSGLESAITVRNGSGEFGAAPGGYDWKVDHGIGNVVRLADGQWHEILAYRVLGQGENYGHSASPHTGLHVEEVVSLSDPRPMGLIFVPEPSSVVLLQLAAAGILGYILMRVRRGNVGTMSFASHHPGGCHFAFAD